MRIYIYNNIVYYVPKCGRGINNNILILRQLGIMYYNSLGNQ